MNDMQKVALVAGASGLVGQRLVTVLCEAREYSRVYALTRRPLTRDHQKLANRVVRFADLEMQLRGITCSEAFCCLGTTRREAGSEAAFRQVDFELVLAFARAARAAQAQRFVLVSSVGADADSRSLYLRVKAQTELRAATCVLLLERYAGAATAQHLKARVAVDPTEAEVVHLSPSSHTLAATQ